jgi:hypothetical protein
MHVFELRYPGAWIQIGPGPQQPEQLIGLLHHLEHQLADAAVGLAGLQEAVNRMQSWKPGWSRRRNATTAVAHAMEAELPATLTMQQRFAASNEISLAADLQVRRAEWAEGSMPEDYAFRVAFIHAHTVLALSATTSSRATSPS